MIDVWLLMSIGIPFFEVILHTIHHNWKNQFRENATKREEIDNFHRKIYFLQKFSRKILPLIYGLFVAGFFSIGVVVALS